MTIPFLDLFKKLTGRFTAVTEEPTAASKPVRAPKKPEGQRLSKTVLPNATRSSSHDPFPTAGSAQHGAPTMQLGAQRITAAPKRPQTATSPLPPALARALEPKLERAISLKIADFIEHVPTGYIKPVEILDSSAPVSLKASEIEKGMPEKNPTISLPSLYQQVPEIFLKGVRPDDDTRVQLPYEKVLEQFKGAQVRTDQMRDPRVPQLDTPILTATIQDSKKFGTKIEPIETSPLPSVPVEPATAETIAAAEPEAIVQETAKKSSTAHKAVSLYSPDLKPKSEPPSPQRKIPFELSPNGTGGSASERVPASSGPPVPTPSPFTPDLPKIPLQSPAEKPKTPSSAEKPAEAAVAKSELKLKEAPVAKSELKPKEAPVAKPERKSTKTPVTKPEPKDAPTSVKDETLIKLSLKAVMKNLPAFQFEGDIAAVSDEARVAFPLSLIEPQLASGRISIAPDVFQNALPQSYREMFQIDELKTPVALPLEEVLKNLPATILKLRDDQEHVDVDKDFETPFSIQAKEDAKRLATEKKPAEKTPEKTETPVAESKIEPGSEKKIDAKEVVSRVNALAGVKACAITFSDGLSLAGELPAEIFADGLCAMAPSIFERVAQHVRATKLEPLAGITLYAGSSAISFFASKNICLAALHAGDSLSSETRTQIADLVEKLSNTFTQPEKPNVDH